jgi:hypothetical protein
MMKNYTKKLTFRKIKYQIDCNTIRKHLNINNNLHKMNNNYNKPEA